MTLAVCWLSLLAGAGGGAFVVLAGVAWLTRVMRYRE